MLCNNNSRKCTKLKSYAYIAYFSGTNGSTTFRPKLSRRWSLDNLAPNSSREGYVKDLRRQHKAAQQSHAAMDEGYPFMLTEARRVNIF